MILNLGIFSVNGHGARYMYVESCNYFNDIPVISFQTIKHTKMFYIILFFPASWDNFMKITKIYSCDYNII